MFARKLSPLFVFKVNKFFLTPLNNSLNATRKYYPGNIFLQAS
jgi:hypothetical protein